MIRPTIACAAVLSALAVMPAAAADLPPYIEAPPAMRPGGGAGGWGAPYYVVNQGPELSGPGIMIVEIGLTSTDMKRSYPFIGTSDDLTRAGDHYLLPATLDPALGVRARARSLAAFDARAMVPRRKPVKVHRAR